MAGSRYADRPGNRNFDPRFKRDCQTCHMQQDYGQPGTAQTLYERRPPVAAAHRPRRRQRPGARPAFSHHFIGGNAFVPRMVGADVDGDGHVAALSRAVGLQLHLGGREEPLPQRLLENVTARGAVTQHARLAWDRLRNVLDLDLCGPGLGRRRAPARPCGSRVTNSGSGHDFPSGFPEGRTAWVAVRAFDLASGRELDLYDSLWKRTSQGVGYLTRDEMPDPNFPALQAWKLPAGSPDPYAVQFKAIASLATAAPPWTSPTPRRSTSWSTRDGLPIDAAGRVIDRDNPRGLPRFRDLDGDGDLFDDAFLSDTRLRPLPHAARRP